MSLHSIIIGAGISGLVAAYHLKKLGREVLLIESSDRVGGVIQSQDAEGFLIERGPNSLRGTHEFLDLAEQLGLMNELVTGDPKAPAYVCFNGNLHPVPMSPPALVRTKLISGRAKLRLLREPFIKARRDKGEESLASFIRRRLGPELLDRLVAPFVSGVYAGDPERMSVQATFGRLAEFEAEGGSILGGALRAARASREKSSRPKRSLRPYRLCSFRDGLQRLPEALAKALGESLMTGAQVTGIGTDGASVKFEVSFEHRGERKIARSSALIVAAPADAAAGLLGECAPEIAALVADVPYTALVSLPLGYRREQLGRPLDGFGFLAPRSEGLRILGSIWNSSLFPERAPEGWALMNNFIGGETDPEAVSLSDEELIRIAHNDLKKVLGVTGEPRRLPVTRRRRAIPQYNLGHAARVAKIEAALKNRRGLWLAGNYLRGVSLGDCIREARRIGDEVDRHLLQNA
ncbi:MAG TPA: protoporphyrinogen oxidase [Blastocatellia bacterium]|nr:protoporphyrinogen oxidase [Blastocatellia bacterium]